MEESPAFYFKLLPSQVHDFGPHWGMHQRFHKLQGASRSQAPATGCKVLCDS